MLVKGHHVKGAVLDNETRCAHYHQEIDRIAIKFYCCQEYFPCHLCHLESGCGHEKVWPVEKFHEKAVLCGACGYELTVQEYLSCASVCPACHSHFNPGCTLHRHYYFAT